RRSTARAATGEEPVILPDQMLGIRPGRLRTHRKAQRPAMGAFRVRQCINIAQQQISFPSTTLCPPPHVLLRAETGDLTAAMLGRARSDSTAKHRPKQKPVSVGTRFRQPGLALLIAASPGRG